MKKDHILYSSLDHQRDVEFYVPHLYNLSWDAKRESFSNQQKRERKETIRPRNVKFIRG